MGGYYGNKRDSKRNINPQDTESEYINWISVQRINSLNGFNKIVTTVTKHELYT